MYLDSGKAFIDFIMKHFNASQLPFSTEPVVLKPFGESLYTLMNISMHQSLLCTLFLALIDLIRVSNEQISKKVTIPTATTNHQTHLSSSIIQTKLKPPHISQKNEELNGSYPSLNAVVNEPVTFLTTQTSMSNQRSTFLFWTATKNQEYTPGSRAATMTTFITINSTSLIPKSIRFLYVSAYLVRPYKLLSIFLSSRF